MLKNQKDGPSANEKPYTFCDVSLLVQQVEYKKAV
jgi:hypothetical protein